ncbi:putative ABC transporter permease protein [Nocardia brasiliensis NBRC 14402]|uniref:ABC transporter permease n=1 Tax=Nocardia brasiliensis TaxID=37326 RepID=UPI0002F35190|nr:ABC transporter permease [Nocardia brasiliensis]ASF10982.1 ABC transporter permease [Nocardia brasiliensis]GAJ83342.1 putative ABC transporter permease protein [Nocardia brasiliensis NBRC 14402]SUB10366.1 Daunorubicin/doxorubicin resistance ABC transporter permease protein drrB [Nocardia brasiliensis]
MSISFALADSATMLRRNLTHAKRYPSMSIGVIMMPTLFLLIFKFVFGGALEKSSGGNYVDYLAPGMLLMVPAYITASVAVSIANDAAKGIVNRFRTMGITQSSMLTGHVLGALLQALLGIAVMCVVALLIGWRPDANPVECVAALGLLTFMIFGLNWLAVALGLLSPNAEGASNIVFPIIMLPFLGSGLVAPDTMPAGLRQFAEYQPFTPITETVRGLLMGSEIGNNGLISIGWCLVLTLGGFCWANAIFRRKTA